MATSAVLASRDNVRRKAAYWQLEFTCLAKYKQALWCRRIKSLYDKNVA